MIPAFRGVIGQARALAHLERSLARPSHAYLLVGPAGLGKFTCAKAWVQALFCEGRTGCGQCSSCRALGHGNHPDFHVWEPAGKHNTTIDQVREVIRQGELAPYSASHQVHILWADTMRAEAANCLLKTLEEPPAGTLLLLLAQSLSDLPTTLVSRCQRISFSQVPVPAIASWLHTTCGIESPRAQVAALRSGGRPGLALRFATEPDPPATVLLEKSTLTEALTEGDRLAQLAPEQQILVLEDLLCQIRDLRVWLHTGRQDWIGRPDHVRRLQGLSAIPAYWAQVMERLEVTRAQLAASANARLAWSGLACDLVRIQAGGPGLPTWAGVG